MSCGRSLFDTRILLFPSLTSSESQGAPADFRRARLHYYWRWWRNQLGLLFFGWRADRRCRIELSHHLIDEFLVGSELPQPLTVMADQLGLLCLMHLAGIRFLVRPILLQHYVNHRT